MSAATFRILPPLPPPPLQIELTITLTEDEARYLYEALTPPPAGGPSRPIVQHIRNALDDSVAELRAQPPAHQVRFVGEGGQWRAVHETPGTPGEGARPGEGHAGVRQDRLKRVVTVAPAVIVCSTSPRSPTAGDGRIKGGTVQVRVLPGARFPNPHKEHP